MKRLFTKKTILVVIGVGLLVMGGTIHVYWLDGLSGALCEFLLGDTVYSSEYREYKFRRIQKGMTEVQVIAILGEPLLKNPHDPSVWYYAYGKRLNGITDSHFTSRIIMFNNRVVSEIHHEFYFD